jgi:hypothetical protein
LLAENPQSLSMVVSCGLELWRHVSEGPALAWVAELTPR